VIRLICCGWRICLRSAAISSRAIRFHIPENSRESRTR
jgi:hypothetical protein